MKAYKGFNKDMTCRGFQYEEGKTYELPESETPKLCENGFHACEDPLDCLNYYDILTGEFHEVEIDGVSNERSSEDTKLCARKITVGAKLDIKGIVSASIDFVLSSVKNGSRKDKNDKGKDSAKLASSGYSAKLASSGDYAQLASSGYSAKLASSGYYAKLASSGDSAQLSSSGDSAQLASSGGSAQLASSGDSAKLASSGYSAQLASSGYYAQLASSGDSAQLSSSGYSAQLASSGYYAKLASSGYYAKLASSGHSAKLDLQGEYSVGAAIGVHGLIRGKMSDWITLAEWKFDDKIKKMIPVAVRSAQIDGETLKPDTWYTLENGDWKEVNE